jgi:hypothetical protein
MYGESVAIRSNICNFKRVGQCKIDCKIEFPNDSPSILSAGMSADIPKIESRTRAASKGARSETPQTAKASGERQCALSETPQDRRGQWGAPVWSASGVKFWGETLGEILQTPLFEYLKRQASGVIPCVVQMWPFV